MPAGRAALEAAVAKESYNQISGMSLTALQGVLRREGYDGPKVRSKAAAREEIMASRHGEDWASMVF
tara:strand:+ start:103 stop:303 length:201 start_codon:yes stop_codon:yes gene_type:complete